MLNINISFDHEIYFGENYVSEDDVLFAPTERLMDILVENGVSATFFTDVCSVFKYEKLGFVEYPTKMAAQLKLLIANQQDVQLHVHSHWYNTEYKNKKWISDDESYKIHSFGFDAKDSDVLTANRIIKDGKNYLEKLLKTVDDNYQCISYRAGGFCLQPEKELIKALVDNGIIIDSSIVKHLKSDIENHDFSYAGLPKDVNWWISQEKGIKFKGSPNLKKNIFEVPIGSTNKKPLKWYLSKTNVPLKAPTKKGTYISTVKSEVSFLQQKRRRLQNIWNSPVHLSLDFYRDDVLLGIIKQYLRSNDCSKNDYYISVIGHPKLMGDDHFKNMASFIKKAKVLSKDIKFCNMQDVYRDITTKVASN